MKLTITPTHKQADAYRALYNDETTYVVFGGAAGGGKSWLICEWLLVQAIRYPGSKWFVGREELKRLMGSTYVTWTKVCSFHKIPQGFYKLNGQYNYIELSNGSRIDLLDLKFLPTDPLYERFGSLEYTGGAIEEAGEVDFRAFDVIKTRIGRHMNDQTPPKMLITANPKKNWLYTMIYKPWKAGTLAKEYMFIQSLYGDNPYTAKSYEKQLDQISDPINKQRLMYGIWDYEDEQGTLFKFEGIADLWTNTITDIHGKYMTVDVAREGKDKTVFYFWRGFSLYRKEVRQNQTTDVTSMQLKEFSIMENIPYKRIVVDEDGIGGAVVDQCRGVHGFINNSSPLPNENPKYEYLERPNFANLKTQAAWIMAEKVNNHEVSIEVIDPEFKEKLSEELSTYKIANPDDDTKRLRLESKEEQKAIIGRSPDYGDAFIMRGFFELKKEYRAITPDQERAIRRQEVFEEISFDPFQVI